MLISNPHINITCFDLGEHKYVFAIIADRIGRNYYAESNARAKIDKLLGKIAYPLEIAAAPEVTPTPSPETINA